MPEEVLKQTQLFRRFETPSFEIRKDGDTRGLSFVASSETPVQRWYGMEVLVHDKKSVRLLRAETGAMPLLFNHDINAPIGMVTVAKVTAGRLVVETELFSTDRSSEVQSMIKGGLRNVSIAYRVNVIEEDKNTETYRVTDWEPYEVSIVTVPADPSVGIGRGAESEYEVRMVRASEPAKRAATTEASMPEDNKATTAVATAEPEHHKQSALEAEKERRQAILELGKGNKIDAHVVGRWIEDGTPLTKVASELLDVMEERGKANPAVISTLGLSSRDTQRYSLFKAIRFMRFGAVDRQVQEEASFEIECSRNLAKQLGRANTSNMLIPSEVLQRPVGAEAATRAMATTPGAKGGYLVNTDNMAFIDILRNRSVTMNMGARVLSGLVGNVTFPRQTGSASITWQAGEGTSVTATDQALGQLSMTPKTCIAITDVSEQLLRQSSPSAEQFVMADLAKIVALGVDSAVINGTGGAQPLGIKNTPGVTTGQDSASATYAKILAFPGVAGAANAIRGNPGWVTTTAGAIKLMQVQRFSSTDTPVWVGNLLDGSLVGFNAMSSEQIAASNLIFGSWDEVLIGEWGVLELSTDNGGTRFNQAQVGIRAMWMVDVLIRYPQAFVVSVNLS